MTNKLALLRTVPLIVILSACTLASTAIGYFEYSPLARKAYTEVFSLRFKEARSSLVALKVQEPENLITYSLYNYMDCLALFIGEEEDTYEKLKDQKQLRLDRIKSGDPSSPYYLFTQADIHLQWAIARVKFEDYFQAVIEIRRAFQLLEKNARMFPDFMPNKKNLGLLHALVGTVPDQYRWGLNLLGMSGTIAQGHAEIEAVLQHADKHDFVFRDEVYVMYTYLLLHLENQAEAAWKVLEKARLDPTSNPLACFVTANVAMQTGRNDLAITILANKPRGEAYYPFSYLYLMEGMARLYRLDKDADQYLQRFLKETEGNHYIKEAYQKLAWHALTQGDSTGYRQYMEGCKQFGAAVIDEDLTALSEARYGILPDRDLLRVRLLFDGGYFERARQHLQTINANKYTQAQHKLEYLYRKGRVYHALGEYDLALEAYQNTISAGQHEGWYYACNAALMSGRIHELQQWYEKAADAYEQALSMNPDQYKASLHQKAKAGLQRIRKATFK